MTKSRRDLLALVFLVLVVTAFFSREVFTDRTLVTFRLAQVLPWLAEATVEDLAKPSVTSDCTLSYFPRRVFATEMIRQGEIPFWNPHQFCGTPFMAAFQTAVFYPVNVALYPFDPKTQMDLFLYFHFLIAAVFTFLLGRKLDMSTGASLVSAVTFTFCGFMVTRYGQPTFVSTASWLPALFLFGEYLLEHPGFRRAGILGLVFSLSVLAGFPQLAMYNVYALVTYMLLRTLLERRMAAALKAKVLGLVVLSLGLGILVCALQLLPTWELSRFSFRRFLSYEMILSSAHHHLVGLKYLVPDILGHPRDIGVLSKELSMVAREAVFQQNYVSTTGYLGVLPLPLAVIAVAGLKRKAVPLVVLSLVSLLAVFGTPLLHAFYRLLPGFNFSRIDRVVLIYMFSAAVLAGYGFDAALTDRRRRVAVAAVFMVFAACFAVWFRIWGWRTIHTYLAASVAPNAYLAYASREVYIFLGLALASGLVILVAGWRKLSRGILVTAAVGLLLADLLPNALGFKVSQEADEVVPPSTMIDELRADTGTWRFAKLGADVVPSNTATIVGLDDMHGYDALNVSTYLEVLGAVDSTMIGVGNAALRRRIGPMSHPGVLESPILDMLNVKYVLTAGNLGGLRPEPIALVNDSCLPRVYLVNRAHFFDSYESMLAYMKSGEFDPSVEVLLLGTSGIALQPAGSGWPGSASMVEHTPHRVAVAARIDRPCYLVLSDVYYPGWKAFVDGTEVELLRANYALRAVRLGPGPHLLEMEYVPLYFRIGLIFTAAGVGLVALLLASRRRFA